LALLAWGSMMKFCTPVVMRHFEMDVGSGDAGTTTVSGVEIHDLDVRASVVYTTIAASVLHVVSMCQGLLNS